MDDEDLKLVHLKLDTLVLLGVAILVLVIILGIVLVRP